MRSIIIPFGIMKCDILLVERFAFSMLWDNGNSRITPLLLSMFQTACCDSNIVRDFICGTQVSIHSNYAVRGTVQGPPACLLCYSINLLLCEEAFSTFRLKTFVGTSPSIFFYCCPGYAL